MEKIGIRRKPKVEEMRAIELSEIIREMARAMWNANKSYIDYDHPMTSNMSTALAKFQDYCARYHGKKA